MAKLFGSDPLSLGQNLQEALDGKENGLGKPVADGGILTSLANGARSWLASSEFFRSLFNVSNPAAMRAALGTTIGTGPGTVAAGDDCRLQKTFTPEMFTDGSADDTTALQAAVTAACTSRPSRVLLNRMYFTSAPITGTKGITIEGINDGAGITSTVPAGDILAFIPNLPVSGSDTTNAIVGLTVRNLYLEASVRKTSGAALHVRYSRDARVQNVQIGTFQPNPSGPPPNVYDGIFAEFQENFVILTPNFAFSHKGVTFCGLGGAGSSGGAFTFGGYIGGTGKIYGCFAAGNIGIHVAGGNGGVEIGDFDCGQCETNCVVDRSITDASNREFFIGRCFMDAASKHSVYIAENSIARLHIQQGWLCSVGQLNGSVGYEGRKVNDIENGASLVVRNQGGGFRGLISGSCFFNSKGSAMVLYGGAWVISGSLIEENGLGGLGGHGIDAQGIGDWVITGNGIYANGNTIAGWAVNLITVHGSHVITGNDMNGNGQGTIFGFTSTALEQVRHGNLFDRSDSYIQASGLMPYDGFAGFYAGINQTPRALWNPGDVSKAWEIDNLTDVNNPTGTMRWINNNFVWMSLKPSGCTMNVPFNGSLAEPNINRLVPGVLVGQVAGQGRIEIGNGTPAQQWGIDITADGSLRFFQGGAVKMTLDSAGNLKTHGTITPSAL